MGKDDPVTPGAAAWDTDAYGDDGGGINDWEAEVLVAEGGIVISAEKEEVLCIASEPGGSVIPWICIGGTSIAAAAEVSAEKPRDVRASAAAEAVGAEVARYANCPSPLLLLVYVLPLSCRALAVIIPTERPPFPPAPPVVTPPLAH